MGTWYREIVYTWPVEISFVFGFFFSLANLEKRLASCVSAGALQCLEYDNLVCMPG